MSAIGAIRGAALGTAKTLPKGGPPSDIACSILLTFVAEDHSASHVLLTGLPRTTTPADITRLLGNNKVHNVKKGEHAMCRQASFSDLR